MKSFNQILVAIAKAEVGVREIPANSNTGTRICAYQAATWLKGTYFPYCAAFICWVVKQAIIEHERGTGKKITFKRPQTAAAYGFDEWSLAQDASTTTYVKYPLKPKSVGIFSLNHSSHCGLAISAPDSGGFFKTVEGNTDASGSREGGGVYTRLRHVSDVRDFITFNI